MTTLFQKRKHKIKTILQQGFALTLRLGLENNRIKERRKYMYLLDSICEHMPLPYRYEDVLPQYA